MYNGWTPIISDGEKARAIKARLEKILAPDVVERMARQCARLTDGTGDFLREWEWIAIRTENFVLMLDNDYKARMEAKSLRAEYDDLRRTQEDARY